jgi:hypothetical protein
MTYSVYQHWDPLKVMAVGVSYPPQVYDYIKNEKVRNVFYKIAEETEEDYQKLISLLGKFNVEVVRPDIDDLIKYQIPSAIKNNRPIPSPNEAMQPRDVSIMLGEEFCCPDNIIYKPILDNVKNAGNKVTSFDKELILGKYDFSEFPNYINAAMTTRLGKDLYVGTLSDPIMVSDPTELQDRLQKRLPNYRVNVVDTQGHADGTYCPVVPGLIVSMLSPINYEKTFPDWEVVYLQGESWGKVNNWINLKQQNNGKWWVPGEELNEDFTNFVETWMNHWVGYVEESVFDVNMLVIDKKNVIVNGYNEKAFDAFSRHGITPHICNFRHRYFWDGGLHCITSDLHREGVMENYFPECS